MLKRWGEKKVERDQKEGVNSLLPMVVTEATSHAPMFWLKLSELRNTTNKQRAARQVTRCSQETCVRKQIVATRVKRGGGGGRGDEVGRSEGGRSSLSSMFVTALTSQLPMSPLKSELNRNTFFGQKGQRYLRVATMFSGEGALK
jgi:hypothetical protein